MDFQTFAARELAAIADKLADVSQKQLEATTDQLTANFEARIAQLTANFEATISSLRNDHAQLASEKEQQTTDLQATISGLRKDHAELASEKERLTAENAALAWEKEQLIETARVASRGSLIERLASVFERIASSRTLDEAVVAAAQGLVGDFNRVAVFFGERRVAQIGATAPLIDRHAPSVMAFPITVRGEQLATIYAADEAKPDGVGTKLADVLRRHVALALERLTIELKTVSELRAYAEMLMDEVEYVFNADMTANVSASERRDRLAENLRCARQIYAQRVTLEGPAAQSVLDEVLTKIVQAKGDSAFGRELGGVLTAPATAA